MSGDIVRRLRAEIAKCPGAGTTGHGLAHSAECCFGTGVQASCAEEERVMLVCWDAADEIERLRAALTEISDRGYQSTYTGAVRLLQMLDENVDIVRRLRAEIGQNGDADGI